MLKLDIISDPICPWCYIGKTELDKALAQRPDHPFEIEWHPFQLNPDMPREGMERHTYLEAKFGGKKGALQAYAPILERAEAIGLKIDFAAIKHTPNTLDAHRLIHWAGIEGMQDRMSMALFAAYFDEGRDIGNADVLADLADGMGMDGAVIGKLLKSDADEADIRARDSRFREMDITGVPTFIVAGQHAVPGCQPADMWLTVIDELTTQAK